MRGGRQSRPSRILRTQPLRKMIPSLTGGDPFAMNRAKAR
jgi:hypothetical protein